MVPCDEAVHINVKFNRNENMDSNMNQKVLELYKSDPCVYQYQNYHHQPFFLEHLNVIIKQSVAHINLFLMANNKEVWY